MWTYTCSVTLTPGQIAAGHDARSRVEVHLRMLGLALPVAMIFASAYIASKLNGIAAFPSIAEHLRSLLQLLQGNAVAYGKNEWLGLAVWVGASVLNGLAITRTLNAINGFKADRAAAGILNRWLYPNNEPHGVLYVPDMEQLTRTQVVAMAYSFNGGYAVLDAVCLDETGAAMLITGTVDNQPFMEARRVRDHYLIQTAIEAHFRADSARLRRALNLQPTRTPA